MKVYYLHLTDADFDRTGNTWLAKKVIDLYDNDHYVNYSTTKSDYGLDSLGNGTWTGMTETGPNTTDAGEIRSGRFIDHTGRITIFDHELDIDELPGTAITEASVNIYNIDVDHATPQYLEDWAVRESVPLNMPILWVNAYRYVVFEINLDSEQDLSSVTFSYDVRVEIDKPVMAPMYRTTRTLLSKFPEWMKIREDSVEPATPELTTPNTLGGHLLNATVGQWLDDIDQELTYLRMQQYIDTADLNQAAWIYYTSGVPEAILSVTGDSIPLAPAADLEEFYEASADDYVYWWDETKQNIYVHTNYTSLEINDEEYELDPQQVWNWFDEHGALVDLFRHYLEDNDTFRKRILDVYRNEPGVSLERFKLALRRELNLWWAFDNATPDSDYLGATPEVIEIADMEVSDEFFSPDGMPKGKFESLVYELAEKYPITWGFFRWNRALWDIGGEDNAGFGLLPYHYDATPPSEGIVQSGVGDGSDLYVYRPDAITGPREFQYRLKVRGRQRSTRVEYPEITVYVDIYGRADKEIFDNPVIEPWFTYVTEVGGITYYLPIQASVQSDIDNENADSTENSYYTYPIIGPDGLVQLGQVWYDEFGNTYEGDDATPFILDLTTASDGYVQWGRWDPDTSSFTDYPTEDVELWFSDDDITTLAANSLDTQLEPPDLEFPGAVVIVSNESSSSIEKWESEHQPFVVTLNGALPDNSASTTTIDVPTIIWDPNLEATPNKEYVIEMTLIDSEGNYVVSTHDALGGEISLDHTVISVNGDNSWSSGKVYLDESSTSSLVFSAGSSVDPEYPVTASVWTAFEAVENVTHYGVVDENGPWRNGAPQEEGAFNFLLAQMDVGRPDFGLSSSDDYVITWIGVDVLNTNRVVAWLDTNVIEPATDDDNEVAYPANAITEEWSDSISNYVFEPFFIRARLRPEIEPQWYPQVHSGWFYEKDREQYLYANPVTETATSNDWVLQDVARQGAPIIVKTDEATPVEYRQIAFFDEATPELSLVNTQVVNGTGTTWLYVAFEDIFDVSVLDLTTNADITLDTSSSSNRVETSIVTAKDRQYQVEYKLNRSFYADHEHVESNANRTRIVITENPAFVGDYTITYEGSDYDPATPVPLPLNTFYTIMDEGFIFISHTEYDLHYIEVTISPTKLVADGEDYLLVSLKSFDEYMNPKGNQSFTLTTTFGNFESSGTSSVAVSTDDDGFATAILISESGTSDLSGYIEVNGSGLVDATVNYDIEPVNQRSHRLVALPSSEAIPADGESITYIFGKVEDENFEPVPYATVAWKRARSVAEAFQTSFEGQLVSEADGTFAIGPFDAATPGEPGYWFAVVESWEEGASPSGIMATPNYSNYNTPEYGPIGDVVFWHEYPDTSQGVNEANELPVQPIQMEVNPYDVAYYSNQNAYPVTYDDATPLDSATPVTLDYEPPAWYAINRYTQYQLGLLGTGFYSVDLASLADAPPDYKDL